MRALPVIAGLLLACLADSAYALNGNIYVLSCACQTTDDFSAAAMAEANDQGYGGTFLAVSTSQAGSALMQVRGKIFFDKFGNDFWAATSGIPMDDSGDSLAGEPETSLEAFYQTYDQTTFGVSRNAPAVINEPTDYAGSFINSSEEEVEPGIGVALGQLGIDPGSIPVGTTITVKFDDGTTAQYVKVSPYSTYQWTWNGVAHDKNHHIILRNGTLVVNPNTGGTGGGAIQTTGFGPEGSGWSFGVGGFETCTSVTTITVNGEATDYAYVHPC